MKIKEIVEGWGNHFFPKKDLEEAINEASKERLKICLSCENNSTFGKVNIFSTCKACGCNLIPKSKCLSCSCPINKWGAITTEEIDNKINESL